MGWLSMHQIDEDGTQTGTVLGAQTGAEDYLRVVPIADAKLPDDKRPAEDLLDEADLATHGPDEIKSNLKIALPSTVEALSLSPADGKFLASAEIESVGWNLMGIIENPAMAAVHEFQGESNTKQQRSLLIILLVMVFAIGLAFAMASYGGKRAVESINALSEAAASGTHSAGRVRNVIVDTDELHKLQQAIVASQIEVASDEDVEEHVEPVTSDMDVDDEDAKASDDSDDDPADAS